MRRVSKREMRRVIASQNMVAKSFLKRQKGARLESLYETALRKIEFDKRAKRLEFERGLREWA